MGNQQKAFDAWYGPGGALVANHPVTGLDLRPMDDEATLFYGGRYLIAESMTRCTAQRIANALGLIYRGDAR